MKKVYGILAAFLISATLLAQATPQEKREIKNDLVRERDKRIDATRDVLRGEPERARVEHREAVVYHKAAVRKAQQIHRRNVRRHHTVVVVRKRYHHRPYRHRRAHTVVVVHP